MDLAVFAGIIIAILGFVVAAVFAVLMVKTRRSTAQVLARFACVTDADKEAENVRASAREAVAAAKREVSASQSRNQALRAQYVTAKARMDELQKILSGLEESLEVVDAALYQPHFTYTDSELYKAAVEQIRQKQKEMIKAGKAAICGTTWSVGGSTREGEKMTKQTQKLILRAFNAESDAAVANVNWNNFAVMANRIQRAFQVLNDLGQVLQIKIEPQYLQLRIDELRLVFETAEKKQQEREEQRRQRAEQKEEERVQRELMREQENAVKEETKFERMLEKARQEVTAAKGAEQEAMNARIGELEKQLADAHSRKERAVAQAQLTRVGHVYIISNVGAFGEGVVKIGLTRRLDPEDRVRELGDASVPFGFDIHAMIYSDDAPALENRLQTHFWERRLNWANDRKEFFRVNLQEVQSELRTLGLETELLVVPEAKEYRQTLAALAQKKKTGIVTSTAPPKPQFPDDAFEDMEA